ncbi:TPA: DNA-3-methyladenine glycosylase 2 family protein [Methanosarcina acetivorans]|uniref:DNA-(apurinic or apyrimidinic site) lyase n=2 Tax=Methanosarcina acetivorans TaxID=2214 RepID=Q8TK57_METAC|nr:DNA-3-methyladenine glycosylase [Methanosarcina acetivorans]AAM06922.1 8-oxoguanine DNA glycosylase [Methanosarcina acetivorans C2A]HIH94841.1 DNA-3-methyladenine glycosylase 2 family protein [Methanosarcina acetivorans]
MYRLEPEIFNLDYTLDCGQVFRWEKSGDWWTGVVGDHVIRLSQEEDSGELLIDSRLPPEFFSHYFRLDDDLPSIYESINKDLLINRAINKYSGLRLIRQDPWECLISYMLATASSIPTIQKRIYLLSRFFGQELEEGYFSFPDPDTLAEADLSLLDKCKLGFRTERIKEAARDVASGELDLNVLYRLEYRYARERLMRLRGIGEKVADCVLLFAFEKMEAFPVDTHVRQIIQHYHIDDSYFETCTNLSCMGEWGREYFGYYCGYAQQYLFYQKRLEGFVSLY